MISVTILVKEIRRLPAVLFSIKKFPDIVIIDTQDVVHEQYLPQIRVIKQPFSSFGTLHNFAAEQAHFDWILSIDADEILSEELVNEILELELTPRRVYALPFKNYVFNRWVRHSGWFPEHHIRLYHRNTTAFTSATVHEGVRAQGLQVVTLHHYVHHYPYDSLQDFVDKMQFYSNLFVQEHLGKRNVHIRHAIVHGITAFVKHYFLRCGFLDGTIGLVIAYFQGSTAWLKYLKLYYATQDIGRSLISQDRERKTLNSSREG